MSDQPNPNQYVTSCAIACNEGAFAKFLEEQYSEEWTATPEPGLGERNRATRTVYAVLGIKSRTELRTDPEKIALWRDLKAEYDLWMGDV